MQSFRQYRRFRTRLEEEIQHHGLGEVTRYATAVSVDEARNAWGDHPFPTNNNTRDVATGGKYVRDDEEARLESEGRSKEKPMTESGHFPNRMTGTQRHDSDLTAGDGAAPSTYDKDLEKEVEVADPLATHDNNVPTLSSLTASSSSNVEDGPEAEADIEKTTTAPVRPTGTRLGRLMTGISIRSCDSRKDEQNNFDGHIFLVNYQGSDDPMNPHNWSRLRRTMCTFIITSIGFIVGLASSIDSPAIPQAAHEFHVSEVAESLATGLYLVGFGFGAFFAAPISETVGRNPVYLVTGIMFMVFIMASALAPNLGAQLVFRFLAGFFGSTPLTCAGGSLSDMWSPEERTETFPMFAFLSFFGPVAIGPTIGGFVAESTIVTWRWCDWVTLIWSGLIFVTVFLFMPETYTPILLKWKAEHLRALTGDSRYMSAVEVRATTFRQRLLTALYRPWLLMFFEPTIQLFTLYMSVVYIILFTFLTGFPCIFQDTYGISQGRTFLIFMAIGVGFVATYAVSPWITTRYRAQVRSLRNSTGEPNVKIKVPPEQRLWIAILAAPTLPIGLFWLAWTANRSVSIWSSIFACVPIGFGTLGIFIATYQYVIDSYETFAASGLVGLTFVRYCVSGGMIPVSIPFYHNVGVHWTLTVLAVLSALLVPVPFVFYRFGPRIRRQSRMAVKD